MSKAIDQQFRLLYAFAIIIVVASHCGRGSLSLFYEWFTPYAFHLGIFAFGSGYFYREEEAEHQLSYLWRKIRSFLVPVYACNLFYGIFAAVLRTQGFTIGGELSAYNLLVAPLTTGHQFLYNLGAWFVAPLFMVVIFNNLVFRLLRPVPYKRLIVFLVYLGLGMLGVHLANIGLNKGCWLVLDRMLFFLPMYALGMLYRKYRFFDSVPSVWYFAVIFVIQLACIHWNGALKGNNAAWMINLNQWPLPFILEFLGILFWLRMSRILLPALGGSRIFGYIGANTFSIMTHHLVGFMLVNLMFLCLSELTPYFANFNLKAFKTNIWYLYVPDKIHQYKLLYLVAGIMVPLLFSYGKDALQRRFRKAG